MLFLQTLEKDGLAIPTVAVAAVFVKGLRKKKKERKKTWEKQHLVSANCRASWSVIFVIFKIYLKLLN